MSRIKTVKVTGGSAYGLSPVADPRLLFPRISLIPGLFQAGQTTYPGYGVSPAAMSGILAAETLLQADQTQHVSFLNDSSRQGENR